MTSSDFQRGRYGRPLVTSIHPSNVGELVDYTRTSRLAKALDDQQGLMVWKQRVTAVGLARAPHLMDRISSIVASTDDPLEDAKSELAAVLKEADTHGGGSKASSIGTTLHELTEVLDRGDELDVVPERWLPHLDEYVEATAKLEILGVEVHVVNDQLRAAGTLDRLVRLPDGRVVVADLKTGKSDPQRPLATAMQIAVYASSKRYDVETGERSVLHPDIDLSTGLLIHLPQKQSPPTCSLYLLDLDLGYRAAQLAHDVIAMRSTRSHEIASLVGDTFPWGDVA